MKVGTGLRRRHGKISDSADVRLVYINTRRTHRLQTEEVYYAGITYNNVKGMGSGGGGGGGVRNVERERERERGKKER